MSKNSFLCTLILAFLVFSCGDGSTPPLTQTNELKTSDNSGQVLNPRFQKLTPTEKKVLALSTEETWKKLRWITRAIRVFRGGQGLTNDDPIEAWTTTEKSELVKIWLNDSRFEDSILDFNLYFLGFPQNTVRNFKGEFHPDILKTPQVIRSLVQAKKEGNWWALFDRKFPYYMAPFAAVHKNTRKPEEKDLSDEDLRKKRLAETLVEIRKSHNELEFPEDFNVTELCNSTNAPPFIAVGQFLFRTGLPIDFFQNMFIGLWNDEESSCYWVDQKLPQQERVSAFKQKLETFANRLAQIFEKLEDYEPSNYQLKNINEIKGFDTTPIGFERNGSPFTDTFTSALSNSSTNFNRKRGAYVLKRFFCDDLTPIGVEVPSSHANGQHGRQTSCWACHYKLDPISGYFKDMGRKFRNFSKSKRIAFDDGAVVDKEEYQKSWLAPSGSNRTWDIGYVRSTSKEELNTYGESYGDLIQLLKTAPEVKRCVTKRIFQYAFGENQVIDRGWQTQLAKIFQQVSKKKSSFAGIKRLFQEIALSKTMDANDRAKDQCYDMSPSGQVQNRPPCKVAFILDKNCTSCHGANDGRGGLDLSNWIQLPGGGFTFPHVDRQGNQKSAEETFAKIKDRLSTTKPGLRMPLMTHMDPIDRETLFLWATTYLNELPPEN